jgi:hypothetical protein
MSIVYEGWWDLPDRSSEYMTKRERRDVALSPASIHWSMCTNGIEGNIFSRLIYIASKVEKAGLKPYGPKGRQYFTAAVTGLMEIGDYDLQTMCRRCHRWYYPSVNEKLLNLFLQHWKDDTVYEAVILCESCGEQSEKEEAEQIV